MELKAGFKQTEVGSIPEDWAADTIQDLLDHGAIVGHLDGNHGELYPRAHEFRDFGIPYITANDLDGRKVSFNACKFLSEDRARRFRKGVARDGDVLFAHNATVGPTGLLSTELDYVILSTTATYFRCNPGLLANSYLLYALQSPQFVRQYRAVMAQSTRNQVPITAQRKLLIVLPRNRVEQDSIAEVLSDTDSLVESLEQLLAKKRQIKQGAMQELLTGKKRLPGFERAWEEKRIADIAFPVTERNESRADYPVLTCSKHRGFVDSLRFFKNQVFSDDTSGYKVIRHGQIGYPANHIEEGSIGLQDVYEAALVSPIYVVFSVRAGMNSFFLHRLLKLDSFRQRFAVATSASVDRRGSLRWPAFSEIAVKLPEVEEQDAISKLLADIEAEVISLEQQVVKARQLKQGMMQELLTGRIRLI